jgi:hypothetical protein
MSFRPPGDKGEDLAIQVSKKGPRQMQVTIKAEVTPSLCFFLKGIKDSDELLIANWRI